MSIKRKLLFSALSELLLIIIFSAFLIVSSRQMSYVSSDESKATGIVKSITEIRFVTFENILHHDERSYSQWQRKHSELVELLDAYPAKSAKEMRYLEAIKEQHRAIGPLFNQLFASYQLMPAEQDAIIQNQLQERLASQLISKQQIEITKAFKLSDIKSQQAVVLRQQISSLAVAIICLMFLITIINFVFVFSAISRALAILQRGSRAIARGHLDYRIRYKRSNDEFGILAASFNHMAASVEQLDRIKSEFVLMVSHQLRTPATAVKGFISLFRDHYSDNITDKQKALLQSAFEENERQIKLINEILAVAQVDTGEITLNKKPTDLLKLARGVAAEQQLALESLGQIAMVVQSTVLPEVAVDPEKIRIVIENLLHNASKFSPQGAEIDIKLRARDGSVYITVTDHGPGLSHAEIGKLFKKFSHVSKPGTVRGEGSGLGLYLAQRIVHLHHGQISVTSTVGEGTTFTVQLPVK